MHYYVMNILDDDQNKLSLWENDQGKIYMEVGATDNEDAPYYTGFITLTKDDAHGLMDELFRLIKVIESRENDDGPLTLTPPLPNPTTGQLQFPSKINWQK